VRFIRDLSDTTRELWQSRFLLQQLVRRNIRIRYEQAIMGFAWAILRREQ
jgi:ABC-type polysaccharide/polyol phosphate export permease